jgi:hypothetical protein
MELTLMNSLRAKAPIDTYTQFEKATSKIIFPLLRILGKLDRREILYQGAVHNSLASMGVKRPFYPFKCASNYSLLYHIIRTISENTAIKSILELGSGQTTLLLDELSKIFRLNIISIEDDEKWSNRISKQVDHSVIHSPLKMQRVFGYNTSFYDIDKIKVDSKINLIIVDGPIGVKLRSRWGMLQYIESLHDDFVIIFDDAHRRGEKDTIKKAIHLLLDRNIWCGYTISTKAQFIIGSKSLRHIIYY